MDSLNPLIARLGLVTLLVISPFGAAAGALKPVQGPLRIHPGNPRYFTHDTKLPDGSLKAVYLTGSHHWHNLQDAGRIGGPVTKMFDYDGYLDFLAKYNHNFIRLWAWEGAAWWWQGGQNDEYYVPLAYAITPSTWTPCKSRNGFGAVRPKWKEPARPWEILDGSPSG